MFVPNFSSSVGRLNSSGVHFMVALAKMCLVAGTQECGHAALRDLACMVEGTV